MFDDQQTNRRSLLSSLGVGAAALGMGGAGVSIASAATANSNAPSVEWVRTYEGKEREYEFTERGAGLVQTDDGGYVAASSGVTISETGPSDQRYFALLKLASDGSLQWKRFLDDGIDTTTQKAEDLIKTADGGYAVAGHSGSADVSKFPPMGAQLAKTDADGNVQWFQTYTERTREPDPGWTFTGTNIFVTVSQTADGGYIAGGWGANRPWLVKIAADGTKQWDYYYDQRETYLRSTAVGIEDVVQTADGNYVFIVNDKTVKIDSSGNIQWETRLRQRPNVLVETTESSVVVAGTETEESKSNFALSALNAAGQQQWRETYDGPYRGADGAGTLTQTADSGFAIGGSMEAAYSGKRTPAIVKTDSKGTLQWKKLFDTDVSLSTLIQTADGGFAYINGDGELDTTAEAAFQSVNPAVVKLQASDNALSPVGDFENSPTDPDGDGKYEDVNGDGEFDIVDVQALFANRNDPTIQNNPEKFDFNDDGTFDVVDVQALFNELTEANEQ